MTLLRKTKCEQGLYISNNIVFFFFLTKILFPSLHEFRFLSLNFLKNILQNSSGENMDDEKKQLFFNRLGTKKYIFLKFKDISVWD